MTIGIGQILVVALVLILLFGNLPKIIKEIAIGIRSAKEIISSENNPKIGSEDDKNNPKDGK